MSFRTVINFLRELNKNNSKAWMDEHRGEYKEARNFIIDWAEQLNEALAQADDDYQPVSGKKAISRINNNLLYHPDLPTYKDHFGVELYQGSGNSAFYVQIGTSYSFIGGGYYSPSREELAKIRDAVADTGDQLKKIVHKQSFVDMFGELNDEDKLKTSPKGYDKDHEHIDLLRFKRYAVMHTITQEEIMADDFIDKVVSIYKEMLPFSQYLNKAVS